MLHVGGNTPLGFRVLHITCFIFNLWIPLSPLKFERRPFIRIVIHFYAVVINLVFCFFFAFSVFQVVTSRDKDVKSIAKKVMPITIYIPVLCGSLLLVIRKKQFIDLLKNFQTILNNNNFKKYQFKIITHVSKRSLIYLFTFVTLNLFNFVYTSWTLSKILIRTENKDNIDFHKTLNVTKDALDVSYVNFEKNKTTTLVVSLFWTIITAVNVLKNVCFDTLHLTLFTLINDELKLLRRLLHGVIKNEIRPTRSKFWAYNLIEHQNAYSRSKRLDFNAWLQFQKELSELLREFNTFLSPYLVIMVFFNTTVMCLTAYASSKTLERLSIMMITFISCAIALLQTFMYCQIGEKLKKEGEHLSESVCQSPWIQAHPTLAAGLNLVAMDCERSFVVRGGSFFTLSLEFFANVIGVVITYLVVLMQMK